MNADVLIVALRCAVADLIGLYYDGCLGDAAKKTIVESVAALKAAGEDVSEYLPCLENILEEST